MAGRRRRHAIRSVGIVALLMTLLDINRVSALADQAQQANERIRRRRRREADATLRGRFRVVSPNTLAVKIREVFGGGPLAAVRADIRSLKGAIEQWVDNELDESTGSDAQQWGALLRRLRQTRDTDTAIEILNQVGLEGGQNLEVSGSILGTSSDTLIGRIIESIEIATALLRTEGDLPRRANAARRFLQVRQEDILSDALAVNHEVLLPLILDIHNNSRQIAGQYTSYWQTLNEIIATLERAKRLAEIRSQELLDIVNESVRHQRVR